MIYSAFRLCIQLNLKKIDPYYWFCGPGSHIEILRTTLTNYQKAVKAAKSKYFSDIISRNCHRPRILFSTINSVINSSVDFHFDEPAIACESFLRFFKNKISVIRQFIPADYDPSVPLACSSSFSEYEPISIDSLR